MLSVLQKKTNLILDPYPHFVIEDALPDKIYDQLDAEWPKRQLLETTPFDDGICYRLKSDQMLKPDVVSTLWKEFAEYHTSAQFYKEMKEIFGDLMPNIENVGNTISA